MYYSNSTLFRRAVYAVALVASVLIIGTVAFHYVEGYSYIDAFYFMSMLATAEGPTITPVTTLGKILGAAMAFISIGSVIFALTFIFGPVLGKILQMGEHKLKEEEQILTKQVKKVEKEL
ncbi:MAG: hypothetical protein KGH71_00160 [Candidatus Micrarchaeota archaeon]|nr:hypothetical protein [Candidatus Micrarchaeota archaeon]